ncbi:helix-turn-helix domain-containing protein [Vibrio comitans]|uniref:Helix-turn-helix domain-containing protein n=1 Tax=Vibrio comitans NBRC 102076 TaxID=1219078 RepID=A0A4Y3ILK1_9VIBR|nr:helix-turn-helix domain-containing protein [Vibrio comitans]GEA60373.1 hypothetical protein VCO01S_15660 [Vibrio comitans NBRC 102076]
MNKTYSWEDKMYLLRKEVAQILRVSSGTLANWASEGRGPYFCRMEGKVCYPTSQLKAYLQKHNLG